MSQYPDLRGPQEFHFGLSARIIAATAILALTVGFAVWLHGYKQTRPARTVGSTTYIAGRERPSWADPLAAGLVIAGLGTATALVLVRRR
jgi:hypothetical protein